MLYLFDKDDNLLEIIEEYFDDEMTREINSTYSYKFNIDVKKTDNIVKRNKVGFFYADNFYLFVIAEIEDNYFQDDIKSIYCIHDFQDNLNAHIIEEKRNTDYTITQVLEKVLEGTNYTIGEVDNFDTKSTSFYYITSLAALNKVAEVYEGEYNPRLVLNSNNTISRYLDFKFKLGSETGLRFTYDTNIEAIQRIVTAENHYNVLYGRGSSLETEDGGFTRLIDFGDIVDAEKNKPLGQKYVENTESIAKYGRLEGIYQNEDITDKVELLNKTWDVLQEVKEPTVSYEISVHDIHDIEGFEHYNYTFGDVVIIQDDEYKIDLDSRILKEVISLSDKTKIVTLGYVLSTVSSSNSVISANTDSSVTDTDFPNSLPATPVLTLDRQGFATNDLSWTFENKLYYTYEIYGSQFENFNPTFNHILWKGHGSSFSHSAGFNTTWYYKVRCVNSHGQATEFSNEVSATTYKIDDATTVFENLAITDALIGSLNADKINAGKLKGTYIDARNLTVTDGNNEITLSVSSDGLVQIIQGLIAISDKGIRINLVDSENNILGYVLYDAQGVQVFDSKNNNPIAYFTREGSYIENLQAEDIECNSLVKIVNDDTVWYVASEATGYGSGKDVDNKACSLQEVINNIKSLGMYLTTDIAIEVESGTIKEDLILQNIYGASLHIKLKKGVALECENITIKNCLAKIVIEGETDNTLATSDSITATEINSRAIIKATSDLFTIDNSRVDIKGIRLRGSSTGCIAKINNSKVKIADCDISNFSDIFYSSDLSVCTIDDSRGTVEKIATVDEGAIFTSTAKIPNCTTIVSQEGSGIYHSQSSYTKLGTLYQEPTTSSGNTNTNTASSFTLTNLYTTVEGSGNSTSAKKGMVGQGKYGSYKAHRGHATIPVIDIITAMNARNNPSLQLELTRLNTAHGYGGAVPHPIICTIGNSTGQTSSYWDSGVTFARGDKKTIILDESIVNGILAGATELQFWASSSQATQYSFYNKLSIKVVGTLKNSNGSTGGGSSTTTEEVIATAKVLVSNLNVRTGPGTSYNYAGVLYLNDIAEIVAVDSATGWYKIRYNNGYGWISNKSSYTEIVSGSV